MRPFDLQLPFIYECENTNFFFLENSYIYSFFNFFLYFFFPRSFWPRQELRKRGRAGREVDRQMDTETDGRSRGRC